VRLNRLGWVRSVAYAILGKVLGKSARPDTATRMAMDADFGDRNEPAKPDCEPLRKVDPIDELARIVGEAQEHDAEDERRLGHSRRRDRPLPHPRPRSGRF
jgi:hypothetical protein